MAYRLRCKRSFASVACRLSRYRTTVRRIAQGFVIGARGTSDLVLDPQGFVHMAPKRRGRTPPPQATAEVLRRLSHCGTKTGMSHALSHLSDAGWLRPAVMKTMVSGVRRKITSAVSDHADAQTPYGTVVQRMAMPLQKLRQWDYIHPMALLYYLSIISFAFALMLADSAVPGIPMRLIIYIDEICPGNPLRPDKARTLQAIYWCCADWPQWVLQRTAAWPCFGTIRSALVKDLPGGCSQLMKMILKDLFSSLWTFFS